VANAVTIDVLDADTRKRLNALALAARTRLLAASIRPVARQFLPAIKGATPAGETGNLKRSMTQKIARYAGAGVAIGFMGPNWWNKGRHGHLVSGGTKQRFTKAGANRGIMPADPFFENWYRGNEAAMEQSLTASLKTEIEKEWGK